MVDLLVVAVAMAVTDVLGTVLVVAESKGRAWLAGAMDALGDVSRLIYTAVGVDALVRGSHSRAVTTMAVICATSFVATSLTTRWARHLKENT